MSYSKTDRCALSKRELRNALPRNQSVTPKASMPCSSIMPKTSQDTGLFTRGPNIQRSIHPTFRSFRYSIHSLVRYRHLSFVFVLQHNAFAKSKFAQHFFCISINGRDGWTKTLQAMAAMNVRFFIRKCGKDAKKVYPEVEDELTKILNSEHRCNIVEDEKSNQKHEKDEVKQTEIVAGSNSVDHFVHFAAGEGATNPNIWEVIASHYQSSFVWQTWGRQRERCDEVPCERRNDYKHEPVVWIFDTKGDWSAWDSSYDHSKLGISLGPLLWQLSEGALKLKRYCTNKIVVCFGDMNRSHLQIERGGGYICSDGAGLQAVYNDLSEMLRIESRAAAKCTPAQLPPKRRLKNQEDECPAEKRRRLSP